MDELLLCASLKIPFNCQRREDNWGCTWLNDLINGGAGGEKAFWSSSIPDCFFLPQPGSESSRSENT